MNILAVLLTLSGLVLAGCGETRRPDVVVITLDTTRADCLDMYGKTHDVSPELDRFAQDAVVFRRAWSAASWTLPSHASLFTGKLPLGHGARMSLAVTPPNVPYLAQDAITLAELLHAAGYRTGAFVAANWFKDEFGLLQGYEERRVQANQPADVITGSAIEWFEKVPRDQPMHLLVNYFDPHWPYNPPAGFYDTSAGAGPLPTIVDVSRAGGLTPDQRKAYLARYQGEIRFMDHHLGVLLNALRTAGRFEDALVIITADHGELMGEHGIVGHGPWVYEELLRVPLIIRYPRGRGAGRQVDDTTSLVDMLPLIADEAGLRLPAGMDGVPLGRRHIAVAQEFRDVNWIKLLGPDLDRDLWAAMRWPWKLAVPTPGAPALYRLDIDPGESSPAVDPAVERDLGAALVAATERQPAAPGAARPATPETIEHLRALGYVQ